LTRHGAVAIAQTSLFMRIAWVRELLRASALIVKKTGERAVETHRSRG
jgi:hypothetical protein